MVWIRPGKLFLGMFAVAALTTGCITERADVNDQGALANQASSNPVISSDGNLVVFASSATNLVSGDSNGKTDVFVRDRAAKTTVRLKGLNGTQTNGDSWPAAISDNNRYVTLKSRASNLTSNDTTGDQDVFRYDRNTNTYALVSNTTDTGTAETSPDFTTDNASIVGYTMTNIAGQIDTFMWDSVSTASIKLDDQPAANPFTLRAIRYVGSQLTLLISDERGLVKWPFPFSGQPVLGGADMVVTSVSSNLNKIAGYSANGNTVVVDVPSAQTTTLGCLFCATSTTDPQISDDGTTVVYTKKAGSTFDLWHRNLASGTTEMLNTDNDGNRKPLSVPPTYSVSGDGIFQALISPDALMDGGGGGKNHLFVSRKKY